MSLAKLLDLQKHMAWVAAKLYARARRGVHLGRNDHETLRYLASCCIDDDATRTRLIFTRDAGHHTSGWFRNPDYERCWHLSTSPFRPEWKPTENVAELDAKTKRMWLDAFFGENVRFVWAESPKTKEGKESDVWHWRLFCDEQWRPHLPRKEVYSSEFTERGWRSASQVLEEEGRLIISPLSP